MTRALSAPRASTGVFGFGLTLVTSFVGDLPEWVRYTGVALGVALMLWGGGRYVFELVRSRVGRALTVSLDEHLSADRAEIHLTSTPLPKQTAQPRATTVGDESVTVGRLAQGTRVGNQSVVIGPTHPDGSLRISDGAYGYGAEAGPGSTAIGAGAKAGVDKAPPLAKGDEGDEQKG